jgi:hypothetical protein
MRWTKQQTQVPQHEQVPQYEHDQTRVRCRFLWLPKEINGESRWLEQAAWIEKWESNSLLQTYYGFSPEWVPVAWALTPRQLSRKDYQDARERATERLSRSRGNSR